MSKRSELGIFGDIVSEERTEDIREPPKKEDTFIPQRTFGTAAERARRNLNAKLANPLAGYSHDDLRKQGINFAINHQMGGEEDIRAFELGAVLAQNPEKYASLGGLTAQEYQILEGEFTHRWHQPWKMYLVIIVASLSAAVQGMGRFHSAS